ncbi:MAG TPA: SRPBCC family protein [Candidatus Limnocylindrales bacterium]|nr:SRPBCC family protein [Candidatus Limnocylindrales bacterium]
MILTTTFQVDAPLSPVWTYMLDVPRIAHCVPGAQLTEVIDERTYAGKIEVKLGPIGVAYKGRLHLEEVDEEAHTVKLRAEGNESRGRGGASARVKASLSEADGKTTVIMESDVAVSGLVAQFGRSAIMQEVSQRLAQRFANCLEQELRAQSTR